MPAAPATAQSVNEDRAIYRAMKLLEGRLRKPGARMCGTQDVRHFLTLLLCREQREVFTALWLDAQHRLIAAENLFFGTLREAAIYPREVVRSGLLRNAGSVIFAHNHPSGTPEPSRADLALTCSLKAALELVDIRTLDHFIVAGMEAVSLAELGLMGLPDFPPPEMEKPPKSIKRARKAAPKRTKPKPSTDAKPCRNSKR